MYYFTSQFARRTCQHDLYSLSLTSLKFNYHIQQLLSILTRPTWNNVAQACFIILYKLFFGHMTVQTDKHWFDFTISRYYLVPAIPALWPLLTTPPDPASFQWTVRTDAFLSLSVCVQTTHTGSSLITYISLNELGRSDITSLIVKFVSRYRENLEGFFPW